MLDDEAVRLAKKIMDEADRKYKEENPCPKWFS
jgi:hypothetical protein